MVNIIALSLIPIANISCSILLQVTELSRAEKEGRAARNARVVALDEEGNPEGALAPLCHQCMHDDLGRCMATAEPVRSAAILRLSCRDAVRK